MDYAWWAVNVIEIVVRMVSHKRAYWIMDHDDGSKSLHLRNIVGSAVIVFAAAFSVGVGLDGFFFILGSLRMPIILTCVVGGGGCFVLLLHAVRCVLYAVLGVKASSLGVRCAPRSASAMSRACRPSSTRFDGFGSAWFSPLCLCLD